MTYRFAVSPEAQRHLGQLRRYIRRASSPAIASKFINNLVTYSEALQTFPHRGTSRDDVRPGLRVIGFRGRVSIHFSVVENEVTILAYTYAGRNWTDDYQ